MTDVPGTVRCWVTAQRHSCVLDLTTSVSPQEHLLSPCHSTAAALCERPSTGRWQPGPCPPSLPTAFPQDREGGSCAGREAHVCWHRHLATTTQPGGKGSLLQDVIWGDSNGFPGVSENENDGLSACDKLLTSATGSSIMKKGSMTFEEERTRGDRYAQLILTVCAETAKLLGLLPCVGDADEAEPWWN